MNLLLINPYDYRTVQSNPGLISLLKVLEKEKINYAMTVLGTAPADGFKYIEMPEDLLNADVNNIDCLRALIKTNDLTHIAAIDPEGAMLAIRLLDSINRSAIHCSYISYEILFSDEIILPWEKKLKEYDIAYLRICKEVLIQDEVRGDMFCKEVGFDVNKLYYSPVSPLQYVGRSSSKNAIRNRLGLPLDKKILVYSGSFSPYAKHDWWIRIAEALPDNYVFLFTCYDSKQLHDQNFARIGRILSGKGNTLFMGKELPVAVHQQLLQACDVGIALFRPIYTHWMSGRNIRQIGLSSGKFSTYIACGLPVICDGDQDVFCKLAKNYPIVQTISEPEETVSKLKVLSEIGDESEAWCNKLFKDVLDSYNGIKRYLDAMR
jgi:glycosyltransferase involved in cell wall biosynthesis